MEVPLPDEEHSDRRQLDILAIDEALNELATADPMQAQIVELRFFGGLTLEEVASNLGVSLSTVNRQWRVARAWLYQRVEELWESSFLSGASSRPDLTRIASATCREINANLGGFLT